MVLADILNQLPQQIVNGLTLGGIYSLLALGYSMVYGTLEIVNFAHGEVLMAGGFAAWGVLALFVKGQALIAAPIVIIALMFAAAMLLSGFLGWGIEKLAFKPVRGAQKIASLITALGVSIILQNIALLATSGRPRIIETELLIPPGLVFNLGSVAISLLRIVIIAVSFLLMLGMDYVIRKTVLGKAMRATAEDMKAAAYVGIKPDKIISLTFVIGSILAGTGGVLIALYYTQVDFAMGFAAGLKAFTAAVLGGIGNMRGAMLGGIILGLVESFGVAFFAPVYKDVIAFAILIGIMVLRPTGLFGEHVQEKV